MAAFFVFVQETGICSEKGMETITPEIIGKENNRCHVFDYRVASVYGIPSALIFQYIYSVCKVRNLNQVGLTIAELSSRYPYYSKATIWNGLRNLINPKNKDGKKIPPLIKRKRLPNGLCLYQPLAEANTEGLHKFLVEEAVEHGVIPAIILHNIRKAAFANWETSIDRIRDQYRGLWGRKYDVYEDYYTDLMKLTFNRASCTISIAKWMATHPYMSYRTALRGFSYLRNKRLLIAHNKSKYRTVWKVSLKETEEHARKLLMLMSVEPQYDKNECQHDKIERQYDKIERESDSTCSPSSTCAAQYKHNIKEVKQTISLSSRPDCSASAEQPKSSLAYARLDFKRKAIYAARLRRRIVELDWPLNERQKYCVKFKKPFEQPKKKVSKLLEDLSAPYGCEAWRRAQKKQKTKKRRANERIRRKINELRQRKQAMDILSYLYRLHNVQMPLPKFIRESIIRDISLLNPRDFQVFINTAEDLKQMQQEQQEYWDEVIKDAEQFNAEPLDVKIENQVQDA